MTRRSDHVVRVDTVDRLFAESRSTVIDAQGNERSSAEILAAGRALAARFVSDGLRPGDRIAIQMPNAPLYLDVLSAAAQAGLVVMSVNVRFAGELADSIIDRSGARRVVRNADDLPPPTGEQVGLHQVSPDERFVAFTTSGTTSAPKLVVHQHRSIAAHAGDVAAAFGYDEHSVVLVPLPLCGVFGFTVLFAALAGHATIVMPTSFDAEETAALVERHRVTSMHGSDDMFHRLLATDRDLSSIETAGYARFNSALDGIVERCDARGVPLSGLYGMSEVQALFAWRGSPGRSIEERWRPAGRLVSPGAARRVVDGELQLQGPSLFEGYLADGGADIDRALTHAAHDGAWFRTGDLAIDDGPDSFEYISRMGDVMRLGGFLVAPSEIETVVMRHVGIAQAQVVAVDLETGARPVAFVIAEDGAVVDEQAVIAHCASHLARFKCPVRVVTVEAFPVTDGPNGVKIQRTELRKRGEGLLRGASG